MILKVVTMPFYFNLRLMLEFEKEMKMHPKSIDISILTPNMKYAASTMAPPSQRVDITPSRNTVT